MKDLDQDMACAELDGWTFALQPNTFGDKVWKTRGDQHCDNSPDWIDVTELPNYNSLDVLIPLVVKVCGDDNNSKWMSLLHHLAYERDKSYYFSIIKLAECLYASQPQEIKAALLKTAAKWTE